MPEGRYETPEDLLKRAAESFRQESAGIQIQARPLTEGEKARVTKIESAVELINQALDELGAGD